MRADKLAAPGTEIKLDFLVYFWDEDREIKTSFTLKVI